MKKLERLDKYVILPNVGFYGGLIFDGEDIDLCDDHDQEEGYEVHIKQRIENGTLYTDLKRAYTRKAGLKVAEDSHLEVELEKGQLLVYVQGTGFTIPELGMCKVEDAIEQYELLRGGCNESIRNEKENTGSD